MTYYNDIDPFAAQWLRNLMADDRITKGASVTSYPKTSPDIPACICSQESFRETEF